MSVSFKIIFTSIALIFLNHKVYSQYIKKVSTSEIFAAKNQNGINAALKLIGRDVPIYRIDTSLALNFAYDYALIEDTLTQVSFLTAVGTYLRTDSLNAKLIERLIRFRTDYYLKPDSVPVISENLFQAIAFQNNNSSKEPLKHEFYFWKEKMDAFRPMMDTLSHDTSKVNQPFNACEYNSFMIGWTLNKLKDPAFSDDFVNKCTSNNKYQVDKIKIKKRQNRRSDTLRLGMNYDSLTQIDFMKEPSFRKKLGILPASLRYSLSLIYKSNSGIIKFDSWFNWTDSKGDPYRKPYAGQTYRVELISPNKLVITWVYGYVG